MKVHNTVFQLQEGVVNPYDIKCDLWEYFPNREKNDRPFVYAISPESVERAIVKMRSVVKPSAAVQRYEVLDSYAQEVNFVEGGAYQIHLIGVPYRKVDGKLLCHLTPKHQLSWFMRHFSGIVDVKSVDVTESEWRVIDMHKDRSPFRLLYVVFVATVVVKDKEGMTEAYARGIGGKRVFGSGLINVRRIG